jgi:hypothetical protein
MGRGDGTTAFFAFWLGEEIAMLFTVALLSLAVPRLRAPPFPGIRTGWLFIFRTGTHYPLAALERRAPNRWSRRTLITNYSPARSPAIAVHA